MALSDNSRLNLCETLSGLTLSLNAATPGRTQPLPEIPGSRRWVLIKTSPCWALLSAFTLSPPPVMTLLWSRSSASRRPRPARRRWCRRGKLVPKQAHRGVFHKIVFAVQPRRNTLCSPGRCRGRRRHPASPCRNSFGFCHSMTGLPFLSSLSVLTLARRQRRPPAAEISRSSPSPWQRGIRRASRRRVPPAICRFCNLAQARAANQNRVRLSTNGQSPLLSETFAPPRLPGKPDAPAFPVADRDFNSSSMSITARIATALGHQARHAFC